MLCRTKIILLEYAGNGTRLVSVDAAGHIYVWEYIAALLKPSLSFKPHYKGRVVLEVAQYIPLNDTVVKFPPQQQGSKVPTQLNPAKVTREERLLMEEYLQNLALDSIFTEAITQEKLKDGTTVRGFLTLLNRYTWCRLEHCRTTAKARPSTSTRFSRRTSCSSTGSRHTSR